MISVPEKHRVDEEEVVLTAEEEAELEAALDEADRDGGGLPADQYLRELRTKYGRG